MSDISDILKFISEGESFTLLCHVNPDGDAIGSSLGLMHALRAFGKTAEAVCVDGVPGVYSFLPGADELKRPDEAAGHSRAIALDCADAERMGDAARLFFAAEHRANVDHHGTNTHYGELNIVQRRAACAEIVYDIIRELGGEISEQCATCLYTGILTDSGGFAYSNTTSDTMRRAGELMQLGADNSAINDRVFHTHPLCRVRLHALATEKMELIEDGRIAITSISEADMAACGARPEHCDGMAEELRDIDTVQLAIAIRQQGENCKASLRSTGMADVSKIALKKQGGGHAKAAGYTTFNCTLGEAVEEAKLLAREALGL